MVEILLNAILRSTYLLTMNIILSSTVGQLKNLTGHIFSRLPVLFFAYILHMQFAQTMSFVKCTSASRPVYQLKVSAAKYAANVCYPLQSATPAAVRPWSCFFFLAFLCVSCNTELHTSVQPSCPVHTAGRLAPQAAPPDQTVPVQTSHPPTHPPHPSPCTSWESPATGGGFLRR